MGSKGSGFGSSSSSPFVQSNSVIGSTGPKGSGIGSSRAWDLRHFDSRILGWDLQHLRLLAWDHLEDRTVVWDLKALALDHRLLHHLDSRILPSYEDMALFLFLPPDGRVKIATSWSSHIAQNQFCRDGLVV